MASYVARAVLSSSWRFLTQVCGAFVTPFGAGSPGQHTTPASATKRPQSCTSHSSWPPRFLRKQQPRFVFVGSDLNIGSNSCVVQNRIGQKPQPASHWPQEFRRADQQASSNAAAFAAVSCGLVSSLKLAIRCRCKCARLAQVQCSCRHFETFF